MFAHQTIHALCTKNDHLEIYLNKNVFESTHNAWVMHTYINNIDQMTDRPLMSFNVFLTTFKFYYMAIDTQWITSNLITDFMQREILKLRSTLQYY